MLRHPPVAQAQGVCYGRTEMALAPGWQASLAAHQAELAKLGGAAIWSSPASRCAHVAAALSGSVRHFDERLMELDFGAWEGRRWDDLPRAELDRWAADPLHFRPPGGESGAALIARVGSFAAMLRRRGETCIIVSHGGPLRLLPRLLDGGGCDLLAASPALGSLTIVRVAR